MALRSTYRTWPRSSSKPPEGWLYRLVSTGTPSLNISVRHVSDSMPPIGEELPAPIIIKCPACTHSWERKAASARAQCSNCTHIFWVDDAGRILDHPPGKTLSKRGRPRKHIPDPSRVSSSNTLTTSEGAEPEPSPQVIEPAEPLEAGPLSVEPIPMPFPSSEVRPAVQVQLVPGTGKAPPARAWNLKDGWKRIECPFCKTHWNRRPRTSDFRIGCRACQHEFYEIDLQEGPPPTSAVFVICPNYKCGHRWFKRVGNTNMVSHCSHCGTTWDLLSRDGSGELLPPLPAPSEVSVEPRTELGPQAPVAPAPPEPHPIHEHHKTHEIPDAPATL